MIYRKRVNKSSYELKLLNYFLKIALGKRVWYFEVSKPWHTLVSIKDNGLFTVIKSAYSWEQETLRLN